MKIFILHRLVRCITTYHFLSSLVVLLVLELDVVSGRSDTKTKLILQNIRTHLAQKADEIVKKKECESGLILCKNLKSKEVEGDDEKSGEIPPPPKLVRGQHKPTIRVSSKDVTQTFMPKAHKSLFRKLSKSGENEKHKNIFHSSEESDDTNEKDKSEESTPMKDIKEAKKPLKIIKKPAKEQLPASPIKKPAKEQRPASPIEKPAKEQRPASPIEKPAKEQLPASPIEKPKKLTKPDFQETKDKDKKIAKKPPKEEPVTPKTEKPTVKKKKKKTEKVATAEKTTAGASIFLPGAFMLETEGLQNPLCEKHSQIYLKQLQKYQIWALMMYDASAKLSSGILQGNANQLGDFDECLAINAVFKNVKAKSKRPSGIKGKYCLAAIDVATDSESKNLQLAVERVESFQFIKSTIHDPGHFIPRFSTINWGLCVPSACPAEDVEKFLKSQLQPLANATGLQFDIDVVEDNCVVKDDLKFEFETETMMVIMFYVAVLSVSLYGTLLDAKKQEKPETCPINRFSLREKTKEIIMAFSLKKNLRRLLTNENKAVIECVNGIKSVFTVMLYFAHKTIPLGMTPFSNRVFLTKISNQPITILLRTSIIYTDSFLLISGVLTSYNLAKEISEKKKISWAKRAISRFIRLTPALLAVVLFYAYIWDQLGSGPIWNLVVGKNALLCRKYMWRNLIYIQNFFDFESMCAPQTHQLALDMQLSLLAPLFVHLMHTYDKAGVGILQALFILSSIMRYLTTSNNGLSVVIYHGMPVSQLYKTANLLYAQSFHRASPYILGTIVGYYLKKFEKGFDMPKAFAALGWILSFTFAFYSVVSPSPLALRTYRYDVQEAAQYAALSPVVWSLALSWVIVACHLGYGGFLNDFLCRKIFLVFSRISYSIYLTQFLVFFYKIGVLRVPELFSFAGSLDVTELLVVIGVSVIVTLLFDIPMMEVKKVIFDSAKELPEEQLQSGKVLQSEGFEGGEELPSEMVSREDSQESTEELPEFTEGEGEEEVEADVEEDGEGEGEGEEEDVEGEVEAEADYEDEDAEAEIENEGEPEDGSDEEEEGITHTFEIRPLRRSLRMHFSEDSEGKVFKDNPKIEDE